MDACRVISLQGIQENGCSGFKDISELNLWPDSLSAASSWFGVVVFGFGISPFIFNLRYVHYVNISIKVMSNLNI